jgi:hypothetical protein
MTEEPCGICEKLNCDCDEQYEKFKDNEMRDREDSERQQDNE